MGSWVSLFQGQVHTRSNVNFVPSEGLWGYPCFIDTLIVTIIMKIQIDIKVVYDFNALKQIAFLNICHYLPCNIVLMKRRKMRFLLFPIQ